MKNINSATRYCILCFFMIFIILIINKPIENLVLSNADTTMIHNRYDDDSPSFSIILDKTSLNKNTDAKRKALEGLLPTYTLKEQYLKLNKPLDINIGPPSADPGSGMSVRDYNTMILSYYTPPTIFDRIGMAVTKFTKVNI